MGEPLCDATVAEIAAATDGDDAQLILHATMRDGSWCRPGDEVVVFRADSQPCPWVETGDEGTSFCRLAARADSLPTREQVAEAITEAITEHVWAHGSGEIDGDGINEAADAVMRLLSGGVPTEPEETIDEAS